MKLDGLRDSDVKYMKGHFTGSEQSGAITGRNQFRFPDMPVIDLGDGLFHSTRSLLLETAEPEVVLPWPQQSLDRRSFIYFEAIA